MATTAAGATGKMLYEDFEPFCKWHPQKEKEILEIDLKGFKKQELAVRTNNKGKLVVHGQRAVDGSKWSRFNKEVDLPEDCNVNEIRARFSHGVLSIVMPKKVQPLAKENISGAVEAAKDDKEACRLGSEQQKLGLKEKDTIWEVKISKKRAFKVAVIVVVAVMLVAIGTQIAKLLHRNPYDADN